MRATCTTSRPELFGRGDELQELQGLIDSHAVVTVTGAGGIGKTGLAQGAVTTACAAAGRLVGPSSRRFPTRRRWRARLRCRCAGAAG